MQVSQDFADEYFVLKNDVAASKVELKTLNDNLKQINSTFDSLKDENSLRIQVIEDNLFMLKKENFDKSNSEILLLDEKSDLLRRKIKNCYDAIVNLSELVSALVEFSIITNAVLDQEEKDKKDMQKYNSELQLPPLPSRKLSMPQTDYVSGKSLFPKPQAIYNPTPLKYKNVIYTREELIELVGSIISRSWTEASSKPPFAVKTTKKINASQKLNLTINPS